MRVVEDVLVVIMLVAYAVFVVAAVWAIVDLVAW